MSAAAEATPETPAGWAILLEDYLVARTRLAWAREARPAATLDQDAHVDEARATKLALRLAGGEAAVVDPADRSRATRIALARLRNDREHGRCLCASPSCARTIPAAAP